MAATSPPKARDVKKDDYCALCPRRRRRGAPRGIASSARRVLATDGEGRRGRSTKARRRPRYGRREHQESEQLYCALATDGEGRGRKHERRAPAPLPRTASVAEEKTTAARRALAAGGEGSHGVEPPPRAGPSTRTSRVAQEKSNGWEPAPSPPTAREIDDYTLAARAREPANGCKLRLQRGGPCLGKALDGAVGRERWKAMARGQRGETGEVRPTTA